MEWNPAAIRQPLGDSGPYTGGAPKCLWHTTEGLNYPGPGIYHGTNPHFTADVKRRRLYQHCSISRSAKALAHPSGTGETNHDNVVQVEVVWKAAITSQLTLGDYRWLAQLARWIEKNHRVPRRAVKPWNRSRLSWQAWHGFAGHLGHMHAPSNDHTDPGRGFRIDLVLANPAARVLKWTAELLKIRAAVRKIGHWTPKRKARANKLKAAIKKAKENP